MIRWGDPSFGILLGAGYLGLLTLLWITLLLGVGRWAARWSLPRPSRDPESDGSSASAGAAAIPGVTVCIPARNEAANIATAVRAALSSQVEALEVIVVDDNSEDETAERAREAAAGDPRLRVIQGRPRPEGWAGKPWAVSQGAADAAHDFIAFVDADVELSPQLLPAALQRMARNRLDLLSVFGTWRLESFWERVVIPVVGWLIRGSVNMAAVNDPARSDAFANGQFILVRRSAYEAMGGHGTVRAEVLEDVRLAQAFKHDSRALGLFYAPWAFRVRLYRSFREIIEGYAKNFYEGMGRAPHVALGLNLFILVGTLFPYLLLLLALVAYLALGWTLLSWPWLAWTAAICLLQVAFRWRVERIDGRSGLHALSHPLGNLVLMWIVFRSMTSVEVEWKGRRFRDGKVAPPGA